MHSRKNQVILNEWLVFQEAKGLIDMRTILEMDGLFGIELTREGDAAPLQLTTLKWGKIGQKTSLSSDSRKSSFA